MVFSQDGAFWGLIFGIICAIPIVFLCPKLPQKVDKAIEQWGIAAFVITITIAGGFISPMLA